VVWKGCRGWRVRAASSVERDDGHGMLLTSIRSLLTESSIADRTHAETLTSSGTAPGLPLRYRSLVPCPPAVLPGPCPADMASTSSSPAPSHALFLASSAYLPTAPSAASLPTESKLRLYGLFKLLTTPAGSDGSGGLTSARPSFWQVEARSKWDAWSAAGKEFGSSGESGRAEARRAYVEIARSVGFEGASLRDVICRPFTYADAPKSVPCTCIGTERDVERQAAASSEDDVDLEHLSSDDERDRQAEQRARPTSGSSLSSAAVERKPGGGGVGGKSISRLREASPEAADGPADVETDPMTCVTTGSAHKRRAH